MNKSKAKEKAWEAFSLYIRLRDAIKTTGDTEYCLCVTCGKPKPVRGRGCIQAGHFVAGRWNAILFDERGVHGQCVGCNFRGRGRQAIYHKFMLDTYGQKAIDELFEKARSIVQYKMHDYQEIEQKYLKKIKELEGR